MPVLTIQCVAALRRLDTDAWFGEVLFFPAVAYLADDPERVLKKLQESIRRQFEQTAPLHVHRRTLAGEPMMRRVPIELEPPRKAVGWDDPLTITVDVMEWQQGEHARIAWVPALGIEVIGKVDPEAFDERLRAEVRHTLERSKAAGSLSALARVQRDAEVQRREFQVEVDILSPKEIAEESRRHDDEAKAVLPQVARKLDDHSVVPAHEIDAVAERIAAVLTGRRARSVLLVGASGVGKTAAVHQLVHLRNVVGGGLHNSPFWTLSGSQLVAGQSGFGMWQERCRLLSLEAKKSRAVLHVGNLVELMQVGRSVHNHLGIASFLRPYIARGDLRVIAECTPEQIPVVEREDPQLLDAFTRLDVAEPSADVARNILLSVALARRTAKAAGKPHDSTPIDLDGLDMLDRLHRRYATYSAFPGRPVRFLRDLLADREEGQTITPSDVTRQFSRETGLPTVLLDPEEPLDLPAVHTWFRDRVIGQDDAVTLVTDLLATVKAGLTRPRKPIASLLFIGPTGVGKTEMAKTLAEFLFHDRHRLSRFDMSEYADPVAVQRLVGGIFGSEGHLTAKVREQPFSVLLFDEVEKAHPAFFDLLLQVLGEGRLTDSGGRLADFCNTVVIMTSNLGAESFRQGQIGFDASDDMRREALNHFTAEVQRFLRPELYNRIDRIVPFLPLDAATIASIAHRELDLVRGRDGIGYRGLQLELGDEVTAQLARRGYDPRYGARPLKRAIEHHLLAPLASQLNEFSAAHALDVTVKPAPDDAQPLDISVRVRLQPDGRPVSATAASSAQAKHAGECMELRRRHQALERSPAVLDLHNEIYRLEQRERRMKGRNAMGQDANWHEEAAVKRLEILRPIAAELRGMTATVTELEDDALLAIYGNRTRAAAGDRPPFDEPAASERLDATTSEWNRLLLRVYSLRFEENDTCTLVIFSRTTRRLSQLASSYLQIASDGGYRVEAHEYVAVRDSEGAEARLRTPIDSSPLVPAIISILHKANIRTLGDLVEINVEELVRRTGIDGPQLRQIEQAVNFQGLRLGMRKGDVPLQRQAISGNPTAYVDNLPETTVGLMLHLKGELALARFGPEQGVHRFTDEHDTTADVLVETTDNADDYRPPERVARLAKFDGVEIRRFWNESTRSFADHPAGYANRNWPKAKKLPEMHAELIEYKLVTDAERMLGS